MKFSILLSLLLSAQFSFAANVPTSGKEVDKTHENFNQKVDAVWEYVKNGLTHLDDSVATPELHLEPFSLEQQSPEWTQWQTEWILTRPEIWHKVASVLGVPDNMVSRDWMKGLLDNKFYLFDKAFGLYAIRYEDTNKIQIDPTRTFWAYPFYQQTSDGIKRDTTGFGYYITGHEFTHYALAMRGIPGGEGGALHHCIFLTSVGDKPGLMEKMIDHLAEEGILSPMVKFYGLKQEFSLDPCGRLNAEDKALAEKYAAELLLK